MKHVSFRVLCVIALVTTVLAAAGIAVANSDSAAPQAEPAPFSMMTPF